MHTTVRRVLIGAASSIATMMIAASARADVIPYPNIGTQNPTSYTFTAPTTGEIVAYFAGRGGAAYTETIAMSVNGGPIGAYGLNNQTSSLGQSFVLGNVTAGDTLTFYDNVSNISTVWSSNKSLNSDGANHVYSALATAGQVFAGSAAGTYVGFEDLPASGADFNYTDTQFIFKDVAVGPLGVPGPLPGEGLLSLAFLVLASLTTKARGFLAR